MQLQLWIISFLGMIFMGSTDSYEQYRFSTYIVQNGKRLEINEHVVYVKREPFKLVFEMPDSEGIFVNASFNPQTYNQVLTNVQVKNIIGFSQTAMAEVWRNPQGELLIAEQKPSYWFIESQTNHRFTSYHKVNNRYVCDRNVNVLYDVDLHKDIQLSEVSKTLYLTFIKFMPNKNNSRGDEMMRHELQIIWVD